MTFRARLSQEEVGALQAALTVAANAMADNKSKYEQFVALDLNAGRVTLDCEVHVGYVTGAIISHESWPVRR